MTDPGSPLGRLPQETGERNHPVEVHGHLRSPGTVQLGRGTPCLQRGHDCAPCLPGTFVLGACPRADPPPRLHPLRCLTAGPAHGISYSTRDSLGAGDATSFPLCSPYLADNALGTVTDGPSAPEDWLWGGTTNAPRSVSELDKQGPPHHVWGGPASGSILRGQQGAAWRPHTGGWPLPPALPTPRSKACAGKLRPGPMERVVMSEAGVPAPEQGCPECPSLQATSEATLCPTHLHLAPRNTTVLPAVRAAHRDGDAERPHPLTPPPRAHPAPPSGPHRRPAPGSPRSRFGARRWGTAWRHSWAPGAGACSLEAAP